jgi:hypothetical protein
MSIHKENEVAIKSKEIKNKTTPTKHNSELASIKLDQNQFVHISFYNTLTRKKK